MGDLAAEHGVFQLEREFARWTHPAARGHPSVGANQPEQVLPGVASLIVTCHNCGTRGSFVMEGVTLTAP